MICPLCQHRNDSADAHAAFVYHLFVADLECPADFLAKMRTLFDSLARDPKCGVVGARKRFVSLRREWARGVRHKTHPDAQMKMSVVNRVLQERM